MADELNKDRLGKLVAMARRGEGNEQQVAIRKVKEICKRHHLDFDETMGESEKEYEYTIKYASRQEMKVLGQVIARYARTKGGTNHINKYRKVVIFTTTRDRYIETLNAWDVLRRLYRKEEERVKLAAFYGFLEKHDLYYKPTDEEREQMKKQIDEETEEERKARRMGSDLSHHMEDAKIHKQLNGK